MDHISPKTFNFTTFPNFPDEIRVQIGTLPAVSHWRNFVSWGVFLFSEPKLLR